MTVWRVPGRIEVLGKHTDYAGGHVLVGAVERAVTVHAEPLSEADAATTPGDARDSAADSAAEQGEYAAGAGEPAARASLPSAPTRILASTDLDPEAVEIIAGEQLDRPAGHWAHYVRTAAERLTSNFGPLASARLTFTSDLPPASGMSSSSALLTATALALADLNDLWTRPEWTHTIRTRLDLAGYAASIENGKAFGDLPGRPGVGTSGGSLDHTGMLTSERGLLSLASFDPPEIHDRVPMPPGMTFVVCVSGIRAEKTAGAQESYNSGPRMIADILGRWNQGATQPLSSLHAVVRHLVPESAQGPIDPGDERLAPLRACAKGAVEQGRLQQFLEESAYLVPAAAQALRVGALNDFAQYVERSQRLAEEGLGNQVPETIALVRLARQEGAVAASAFGAGYGGSVWAMVPTTTADDFAARWLSAYRAEFDVPEATTIVTGAGQSARRRDEDANQA